MNPVATTALGLGKKAKAVQGVGIGAAPAKELVERRLAKVRTFRWSSYRAYAGYGKAET
jgi:hypothetical protein